MLWTIFLMVIVLFLVQIHPAHGATFRKIKEAQEAARIKLLDYHLFELCKSDIVQWKEILALIDAGAHVSLDILNYARHNGKLRGTDTLKLLESKGHDGFIGLCVSGSLEEIINAIRGGANVNAKEYTGETALMMAAAYNSPDVINALIDAGADDDEDEAGYTALMYAIRNNTLDAVKALLEAGADINKTNVDHEDGKNMLMFAAENTIYPNIIEFLLDSGADVNATITIAGRNNGKTVLMFAAESNPNPDVIRVLLNAGADVEAEAIGSKRYSEIKGMTALDFAKENKYLNGTYVLKLIDDTRMNIPR